VISTPFMLKQYLTDCFAKSALPFEIIDVFAIPNYTDIFNPKVVGSVEKYESSYYFILCHRKLLLGIQKA
jgi:hypothetical protein